MSTVKGKTVPDNKEDSHGNDEMEAKVCQDRLVLLWNLGLILTVLIVVGQFSVHVYNGKELSVVAWCTQAFSPLLGTMLAKWTGAVSPGKRKVRRSFFQVAFGLSIVYLGLVIFFVCEMGSLKMKQNPADNGNPIHATSDEALKQHDQYRISTLETRGFLLGVIMVPLGASIAACFGGRAPRVK